MAAGGDDWNVAVGNTWFEVYDAGVDLEHLSELVEVTFAGHVKEAGSENLAARANTSRSGDL